MSDNYEKVRQALADNGVDVDGGVGAPHDWRCEYYWETRGALQLHRRFDLRYPDGVGD